MEGRNLDGNAIAGVLREIFSFEVTVCDATCGFCEATGQVGTLVVYLECPGTVVRCPACGSVLMKITEGGGRLWMDMSGVRTLQINSPQEAAG